MAELEKVECQIYQQLIKMHQSVLGRGPVVQGMNELAWGEENYQSDITAASTITSDGPPPFVWQRYHTHNAD